MKSILLASASPRRREFLERFFICDVQPTHVDETLNSFDSPGDYAEKIACRKGRRAVMIYGDDIPVLAADTIVVSDSELLEKPCDATQAAEMMAALSGRSHEVITAVFISLLGEERCFSVTTEVFFKTLSMREINQYVATDEPYDKAGGYGLQGVASAFISEIRGSYSNVIGLPVCDVLSVFRKMGYVSGIFE